MAAGDGPDRLDPSLSCRFLKVATHPSLKDRGQLRALLEKVYPDASKGRVGDNLGQIWSVSQGMVRGDWIVLPSKQKPAIYVAEVKEDLRFA